MRMRICETVPQGQQAQEVQRELFFWCGGWGGWRLPIDVYQYFQD